LLSLVRTKAIGHIRDVRRLVVALSRARLGLYIFGRLRLFENCYELTPAFTVLLQRPTNLMLNMNELWPTTRPVEELGTGVAMNDVRQMLSMVQQRQQEFQQQMMQTRAQMAPVAEIAAPEDVQPMEIQQ